MGLWSGWSDDLSWRMFVDTLTTLKFQWRIIVEMFPQTPGLSLPLVIRGLCHGAGKSAPGNQLSTIPRHHGGDQCQCHLQLCLAVNGYPRQCLFPKLSCTAGRTSGSLFGRRGEKRSLVDSMTIFQLKNLKLACPQGSRFQRALFDILSKEASKKS